MRKSKIKIPDKFTAGLITGLILPPIAFTLLWLVNSSLAAANVFGSANMMWTGFKTSTIVLTAICVNLIPVLFANQRHMEEFIRGIMFPTVIGAFTWFFYFDPLQLY